VLSARSRHFPTSFPHFGPGENARDRSSANVVSFPTTRTIEVNSDVVSASFSAQVPRFDVSLERLSAVCLIIAGVCLELIIRYGIRYAINGHHVIPRRCQGLIFQLQF